MRLHSVILAVVLAALCGRDVGSQPVTPQLPNITFSVSPFFCCGTPLTMAVTNQANPDIPVTLWWRFQPPDFSGVAYDPAACNKDPVDPLELGIVRVHGTTISYDDPLHPEKVCVADGTDLLKDLIPGMYDVSITQMVGMSWSATAPHAWYGVRHRSYPFAVGFTPTAPPAPDNTGIFDATGGNDWYSTTRLGQFTATWSYDPAKVGVTFNLYVDGVKVTPTPIPDLSAPFTITTYGLHMIETTAIVNGVESLRTDLNHSEFVTVDAQPATDRCAVPLGDRAVSVFPTALQKTGSGGAGSKARQDFQVGSPASPITRIELRTGTTVLASMDGSDLTALAGIWFSLPSVSGVYPLTAYAKNAFGCDRAVSTGVTIVIP